MCYLSLTRKIGYRDEAPHQRGLTRLALDSVCGTRKLGLGKLERVLAGMDAKFSTSVDHNATIVRVDVTPDKLEEALFELSRFLYQVPIYSDDIQSAKEALFRDLSATEEKLDGRLDRALREALYWPGHPYFGDPYGDARTIPDLSDDDIREWHIKYLKAPALLTIVGPQTEDVAETLAHTALGHYTVKTEEPEGRFGALPPPDSVPKLVVLDTPTRKSSKLLLAFHSPSSDITQNYSDLLTITCLNNSDGMRLLQGLRERFGLSYSTRANLTKHQDSQLVKIQTQTKVEDTARCLKLLLSAVEDFEHFGPFESDLQAAKSRIKLAQLTGRTDPEVWRRSSELKWLGEVNRKDQPEAVSVHAVRKKAVELFAKERRIILIAGDLKQVGPQLKAAGLGNFEVYDSSRSFFHCKPTGWPETVFPEIKDPWPY